MEKVKYRIATENDISLILCFLIELSVCGNKNICDLDEKSINEFFFVKKKGKIIFVSEDSLDVGLAVVVYKRFLFFYRKQLKNIYVMPEYRKKGYGKGLMETWALS